MDFGKSMQVKNSAGTSSIVEIFGIQSPYHIYYKRSVQFFFVSFLKFDSNFISIFSMVFHKKSPRIR